ncbi:hypothetical protein CROQUDRAFT_33823, partial [Cronartium quercuum f. sp. fusiforme G11]
VATLKRALRKEIRGRLAQIDESSLSNQSRAVSTIIKKSTWYKSSKKIGCYLSMNKGELRTDEIVLDALSTGKEVYIPFCYNNHHENESLKNQMKMFKLENEMIFLNLIYNKWGVREFLENQIIGLDEGIDQGLDLILMPGLGFDHSGRRLGHGKGYYDKYISDLKLKFNSISTEEVKPKMPMLVGLALSEQILPTGSQVPTSEHDHHLDLLIGPDGPI